VSSSLTDAGGQVLRVTTQRGADAFDAVTCSPQASGLTMLNSLVAKSFPRDQLAAACAQTVERNEVCILPPEAADLWRILLTPTLRSVEPSSRAEAGKLMRDLFRASQASEVQASALLVTHFANVRKYPESHLLGILDALSELSTGSFLGLRVLCLMLRAEHVAQFELNLREAITLRARGNA
jgi:hypothetical protein